MRFTTWLILEQAVAVLTACAPAVSLHPLYTSHELAADLPLEGTWVAQDGEVWQVQKSGDGYDATVLHAGDSPSTEAFNVHVLRLKDSAFLDVASKSDPALGIVGHWFALIQIEGDELRVAPLDDDWLKKAVATGLAPRSVTSEANGQVVLTAPTSDLQRFVVQHADVLEAWETDAARFRRLR